MSNFDTAILTLLKHEGLFSDDPHDAGGATKYGISLRWLKSIGGVHQNQNAEEITIDDIKNLKQEQAIELYCIHWWNKFNYEKILDQSIATKVFVLAVNIDAPPAHRCLQRALRAASNVHLVEDGILGNKTLSAINAANPVILLASLRSEAAGYYRSLNNPRYLEGWLNRAYA